MQVVAPSPRAALHALLIASLVGLATTAASAVQDYWFNDAGHDAGAAPLHDLDALLDALPPADMTVFQTPPVTSPNAENSAGYEHQRNVRATSSSTTTASTPTTAAQSRAVQHVLLAGPRSMLTADGIHEHCGDVVVALHAAPTAARSHPASASVASVRVNAFVAAVSRASPMAGHQSQKHVPHVESKTHDAKTRESKRDGRVVMTKCQQYLSRSATIARRPLAGSDKIEVTFSSILFDKDQNKMRTMHAGPNTAEQHDRVVELVEEQRRAFERVDLVKSSEEGIDDLNEKKEKRHHSQRRGEEGSKPSRPDALQLLVFGHGRWFEHPPRSLARCRFTVLEVFDDADLGLGVSDSATTSAPSKSSVHNGELQVNAAARTSALLAAAHTEIGAFVAVSATPGCVRALAAVPAVRRVEPRPVVTFHNDVATRTMQASVEVDLADTRGTSPSPSAIAAGDAVGRPVWDAGLTGEGELIAVSDTGLDIQSCFFHDPNETVAIWPNVNSKHRKVLTYRAATIQHDAEDGQGHGTHVAGSVAGRSLSQYQRYNGIAPDAKLVMHDLHSPSSPKVDVPGDMALYFKRIAETGAKVCTGSWGVGETLGYNAMDRRTDVFMARNPEMLAFFAAGNSNTKGTGSPSKAKNVIAVGAHLNSFDMTRRDTLAAFSSRRPLADGRLKPDVTGPGDSVISAGTSFRQRHCSLLLSRGTSMSTPLIAGASLLIKQHLRVGSVGAARETKRPRPLAVTVKALVVLGAHDMSGVTAETPNNDGEGFGRFRLAPVVGPDVVVREGVTDLAPLKTNQRSDLCIRVTTPAAGGAAKSLWSDVRAALVWTDSPIAVEGSDVTLVNDLDLSISDVDGAVVFGNTKASAASAASKPDRVNNVERVTLAAPAPGASKDYWVYAHDVQDDRPFGTWSGLNGSYTALGQPFSIAVGGPSVTVRDCATVLTENAAWKCPGNCNGRGACVAGKCQCNAGLSGVSCETCDADIVCNGNGQCNPETLQCTCDTTRFNVASDSKCGTCNAGFFGPHCSQRCTCENAGHGTCDRMAGTCTCHAKWGGPLCDRCGKGWAHTALKLDGTPATPGAATQNCDVPSNWCGIEGAPVDVVVAAGTPVMFQPGDNTAVPTRTTCVWRFKSVDGAAASWLKLNLTHLHTFSDDATRVWQGWGDPLNSTKNMKLEQYTSSKHRGVVEGNGKVGLVVRFDSSVFYTSKGFTGVVEAHIPPACNSLCEGGCGARGFCDCSGVAQCKCNATDALGFWGNDESSGTKCSICAENYIRYPVSESGVILSTAVECATPAMWCSSWNFDEPWTPRKIVVGNTTDGKPGVAFFQPGIDEQYYSESDCPWEIRIPPTETVNTWLTVTLTNIKINVNDNIIVHRGAMLTDEVSDPPLLVASAANNGNSTMTVSADGRAGLTVEFIAKAYQFPGRGFIGRITAGPPPPACEARCRGMCTRGTCSCDADTGAPVCACPNDNTRGHWAGATCSHCAAGRTWATFDSDAWAFKVLTPAALTATTPSSEQLAANCTTPAATCIPDGTPVDVLVSNASGPVFLQVGNDVRYPHNIKCQWRIRAAPGERNGLPLSFAVPHADMGNDVVRVHLGQIDGFSASTPHPINKTTGKAPLFPVITNDIAAGFTVTFVSDGEANGRGFTAVAALREPPCDGFCQCSGHGACSCTGSGTTTVTGTCSCAQSTAVGFWTGENCNTCTRGWTSGTITPSLTDAVGCNKKAQYCTAELPTIIVDPAAGPVYLLATEKSIYETRLKCGWRVKAKAVSSFDVSLVVTVAQLDTYDADVVRAIDGQPADPFGVSNGHETVKINVSGQGADIAAATASDPESGMVVVFASTNRLGRTGFVVVVTAVLNCTSSSSGSSSSAARHLPSSSSASFPGAAASASSSSSSMSSPAGRSSLAAPHTGASSSSSFVSPSSSSPGAPSAASSSACSSSASTGETNAPASSAPGLVVTFVAVAVLTAVF